MLDLAIETFELSKRYPARQSWRDLLRQPAEGGTLAVDQVSMIVKPGEIFGLLGPNGAGKSTLVRLLCTLILPSAGRARIQGHELTDEAAIKARVGLATGEERSFYWRLSGRENLHFYGALRGLPRDWVERRIAELDTVLELDEALTKRFDRLSTGMRRRLDLARALLHRPAVLLLDEPTRSLDPGASARLHKQIRRIAQAGQTVFLVTHQLDEAESLCDRVAIMHKGRLRAVAPVDQLCRQIRPHRRYQLAVAPPAEIGPYPWDEWPWPTQVQAIRPQGHYQLTVDLPTEEPADALLTPLISAGVGVIELSQEETSLEEIFQRFTREETLSPYPPQPPPASGHAGESAKSLPQERRKKRLRLPPRLPPWPALLGKAAAFLRRDLRIQFSYRLATLLRILGVLFSVAAFYFVAQLFGEAVSPALTQYGGSYFAFVLIGIAFAGYQSVGLYAFSEAIRSGQTQGTLEAMLVTPTRLETILLASALWSFLQASLQVLVYLLIGGLVFRAPLGQVNVGTALVTLLLSIVAFSGVGILSASFILVAKRGNPVTFVFGGLTTLLSGIYYPVTVLPHWLQRVSVILPMTHSLKAMRLALLQGAGLQQVAPELALLGLFTLMILPAGLLTFRWALRRARIEGSLTQY